MTRKIKRIKTFIALSIIPQIFLVKLLGSNPHLIETYYSNGFYPKLSMLYRYIFGWIPFSIGDIFYTLLGILIVRFLLIRGKWFFEHTRAFFRELFVVVSIAYFVFHLFWGMNYYRQPISKSMGLSEDYTSQQLYDFTERIVAKSNEIHLKITQNDSMKVVMPYSKEETFTMTQNGFDNLARQYPQFTYYPQSVKKSLYSKMLTYMGYSGYLNPFTHEAQVNGLIHNYKFPTTTCHEIAHQLGYSAENEANFVGYLAAVHNEDIYFKYSAYIFVMRYCLGEIVEETLTNSLSLTLRLTQELLKTTLKYPTSGKNTKMWQNLRLKVPITPF